MLSFTGSLKIYLAIQPCDMRKSFKDNQIALDCHFLMSALSSH